MGLLFIVVPGIFILVGIGVCMYGLKLKFKETEAKRFFMPVEGWVKEIKVSTSHDSDGASSDFHRPVYAYTVDSEQYEFSPFGFSDNKAFVGERVTILYNPSNPKDAVVEGKNNGIKIMIFGAVFIIFASVFLYTANTFFR